MDEFRKKPVNRIQPQPSAEQLAAEQKGLAVDTPTPPIVSNPQPITNTPSLNEPPLKRRSKKKILIWSIVTAGAVLGMGVAAIFAWYHIQLTPVNSEATNKVLVSIESGTSPDGIADILKDQHLIRSTEAFLWYTRLTNTQNTLQAGTYRLSPSESTPQIVEHLTNGTVDTFDITFLPGATLADNRKKLIEAGYSASEVDSALSASYDSPLFAGKPATSDLEGYIYGETYRFGAGTTVKDILKHTFDEFYKVVQDNNLEAGYETQGLTLYEGITLASIIQRESGGDDKAQIAQVFYSRLALGMPLGSDVTYQYIADKTGVPRDPDLDSPYNTRRYPGLPPGPIATAGKAALIAAAQPASGDYLYFLSGDDDITYFARTLDEHEANIANHCQKKCQIL